MSHQNFLDKFQVLQRWWRPASSRPTGPRRARDEYRRPAGSGWRAVGGWPSKAPKLETTLWPRRTRRRRIIWKQFSAQLCEGLPTLAMLKSIKLKITLKQKVHRRSSLSINWSEMAAAGQGVHSISLILHLFVQITLYSITLILGKLLPQSLTSIGPRKIYLKITLKQKVEGRSLGAARRRHQTRLKWLQRLLLGRKRNRMNSKDLDRSLRPGSYRMYWSNRCNRLEDRRRNQRNSCCRLREQWLRTNQATSILKRNWFFLKQRQYNFDSCIQNQSGNLNILFNSKQLL